MHLICLPHLYLTVFIYLKIDSLGIKGKKRRV